MTRMRTRRRSPLKKSKQKQKRLVRMSTLSATFDLGQVSNKFSSVQLAPVFDYHQSALTLRLPTVVVPCNESFTKALKNFALCCLLQKPKK